MKKFISTIAAAALLVGTVPLLSVSAADVTECEFVLTPDKTYVHPGETVTYTFSIIPNGDVYALQAYLELPDGFNLVENSGKLIDGVDEQLDWDDLDVSGTDRLLFSGFTAKKPYTDAKELKIATFTCTVTEASEAPSLSNALVLNSKMSEAENISTKSLPVIIPNLKKVEAKSSTCKENGNNEYYICEDNCGRVYKDSERKTLTTVADETLPTIEHSFTSEKVDEKYLVSEANCQHPAVYYKSCSMCGEKGTETFESGDKNNKNHTNIVDVAEVKPTETADGKTSGKVCKDCNEVVEGCEIIPALEHMKEAEYHKAKDATCQEVGNVEYYYCKNCGKYYSDAEGTIEISAEKIIVEKKDHTYIETVDEKYLVSEANCQHPAIYYKSCSMCGEKSTETFENGEKNSENHTNVIDIAEVKATETAEGKTAGKVCKDCGEVVEGCEVIPKLIHMSDVTKVEAKAATATQDGNIEYYICKSCGKYYSDAAGNVEISLEDTVVKATGETKPDDENNDSESDTSKPDNSDTDSEPSTSETEPGNTNPGTGRGTVAAITGIIALGAIIALKKRK